MTTSRPFKPSWMDRVLDWIDTLPFSGWLFLLLMYASFIIIVHAAFWAQGFLPFGEFKMPIVFDLAWIPFGFAYIYVLERSAIRSIQAFRPALDVSDEEFDNIVATFTKMPYLPVLIFSVIGFLAGTISGLGLDTFFQPGGQITISGILYAMLSGGGYMFLPIFLYAPIRQLIQMNRLYDRVPRIDLFFLQPLYGLSSVSTRIGIFLILAGNMNYFWERYLGTSSQLTQETIVLSSLMVLLLGVITFIVPVLGIHSRIDAEKQRSLADSGKHIQQLQTELYSAVEERQYDSIAGMDRGLNTLFTMRQRIQAVPTWPWAPGTFRNFFSALLLPIVLFILQQLLSRLF